jgi:hypothetical protein
MQDAGRSLPFSGRAARGHGKAYLKLKVDKSFNKKI